MRRRLASGRHLGEQTCRTASCARPDHDLALLGACGLVPTLGRTGQPLPGAAGTRRGAGDPGRARALLRRAPAPRRAMLSTLRSSSTRPSAGEPGAGQLALPTGRAASACTTRPSWARKRAGPALRPSSRPATSAGEIRRDRMTDLTRGGGVPRVFVVTRQGGTDTERVAGPAEVA